MNVLKADVDGNSFVHSEMNGVGGRETGINMKGSLFDDRKVQ